MPFANCQQCGRLFHRLDPTSPEQSGGYWPKVPHELCPECAQKLTDQQHNPDDSKNAAQIVDGSKTHEDEPTRP